MARPPMGARAPAPAWTGVVEALPAPVVVALLPPALVMVAATVVVAAGSVPVTVL